jgi:fibrillarin-like pre-rRNA processing protein
MKPTRFDNVFFTERGLVTLNLTPKKSFFDEKLMHEGGIEYREWDPRRSKLAAGIMNGLSQIAVRNGSIVLYLGASHGYTPSFVSDIVGKTGFVFALDFAPRVVRELVFLAEERENIVPILGDANQPMTYSDKIALADVIYQDVAQRNQVEIFLKNCRLFLKKDGFGLFAVKARSIDVSKKPREIFSLVKQQLEKEMTIVDYRILEPFEKDHCMFVCKRKDI